MKKLSLTNFIITIIICSCQNNLDHQSRSDSADEFNNSETASNIEPVPVSFVSKMPVSEISPKKTPIRKTFQPVTGKTLKDAYKDYFPIGAAVNDEIDMNNDTVRNFISTQYSSITLRRSLQPMKVHPQQNVYNWTLPDKAIRFAQDNNLKVRGHCLVYYLDGHTPKWMFQKNGAGVTKDTLLQRMHDHINAVVSRYKGKVYCWDVVNEALSRNPGELFRNDSDLFYKIIGSDYVEKAFEYAHAADPTAKLFYNDDFQTEDFFDKTFEYLKKLKAKGVPIDGVGIQCHLKPNGIKASQLQEFIDKFSSIGLQVQLTELDVSIYQKPFDKSSSDEYTAGIQEKQRQVYKTIFDVCRKNKGKVTGTTFWGYADNDGLNSLTQKYNKKNYPFLFDKQLKPKSFYSDIVNF